jgi:hypothetical protein
MNMGRLQKVLEKCTPEVALWLHPIGHEPVTDGEDTES